MPREFVGALYQVTGHGDGQRSISPGDADIDRVALLDGLAPSREPFDWVLQAFDALLSHQNSSGIDWANESPRAYPRGRAEIRVILLGRPKRSFALTPRDRLGSSKW